MRHSALAAFGTDALSNLSKGSFDLSDNGFSIKGVAKTSNAFETVTASVNNALPEGGQLVLSEITPPILDGPYPFLAILDETPKITLEGYAPSIGARSALADYAASKFPDVEIANDLAFADGAPEEYEAAAQFSIDQLTRFKVALHLSLILNLQFQVFPQHRTILLPRVRQSPVHCRLV